MIDVVCKMLLGCREEAVGIGGLLRRKVNETFRGITLILYAGFL
jgi:hypothetical protein